MFVTLCPACKVFCGRAVKGLLIPGEFLLMSTATTAQRGSGENGFAQASLVRFDA
jgi:hypothetical protein